MGLVLTGGARDEAHDEEDREPGRPGQLRGPLDGDVSQVGATDGSRELRADARGDRVPAPSTQKPWGSTRLPRQRPIGALLAQVVYVDLSTLLPSKRSIGRSATRSTCVF